MHFGQNCSNVTTQIFHSLGQTTHIFHGTKHVDIPQTHADIQLQL